MIGLIIWVFLVLFIVCTSTPEFIKAILICGTSFLLVAALIDWLRTRKRIKEIEEIEKKRKKRN